MTKQMTRENIYVSLYLFLGVLVVILVSMMIGSYSSSGMDGFETQQKHLEEATNQTKLRYHPSEDQIKEMYGFTQEHIEIVDDQGRRRKIPQHDTQGSLLYYQPGSKPYEHYEMDYTDAIMFARM